MSKPLIVLLCAAALTGCATMSEGTSAQVAIETPGVTGADCTVTNPQGKVAATTRSPGSVTLRKAKTQLTVTCSKAGFRTATASLSPAMADKAKLQMPSGYVVDAVSGAMWTYPDRVAVEMAKG